MTNEAYVFKQTVSERKRNGIGGYSKKRRGGRVIRFPSDNLSRKERNKMNGEVSSYGMKSPVAWAVFKKWPRDIQIEYFKRLDEEYNPNSEQYAELFGTTQPAVIQHRRNKLGIGFGKRGRKKADPAKWNEFLHGKTDEMPDACVEPIQASVETNINAPEEGREDLKETAKGTGLNNAALYALLTSLAGSGAKLTIEVTL